MQHTWWCHVHHPYRASTSLEARLKNPIPTFFQVKQVARSRRVPHVIFILHWFCGILWHKSRNRHGDFEAQIIKLYLTVLRPKPGNPSILILRPNHETRAPDLLMHGADITQRHPTSQSSGDWVLNLCLVVPSPLHQVSYSCHDHRRCPSCRTCHLHTTRQANAILHTR
jgi:hypothetical protein